MSVTSEEIRQLHAEWIREEVKREGADVRRLWNHWLREERKGITELPDAGWVLALRMSSGSRISDLVEQPAYKWVRNAMRFWENPGHARSGGPELLVTYAAAILHTNSINRDFLRAALLTQDATIESVAAVLRLKPLFVEAFEALFFNVLDRKDDHAYRLKVSQWCIALPDQKYDPEDVNKSVKEFFDTVLHGKLEDFLVLTSRKWWGLPDEWVEWDKYNLSRPAEAAA